MNLGQSSPQADKAPRAGLLAWGMILFLSVPQIVLNLLRQEAPGLWLGLTWLEWAQLAALGAVWAATWPTNRARAGGPYSNSPCPVRTESTHAEPEHPGRRG